MKYTKPAIPFEQQIAELKSKGLVINNDAYAENVLKRISYYRLRAYTYPFQDNSNSKHNFITQVSFEEIVSLYSFDREIRMLIFDAIERIEIALRTQIIYQFAISFGSHWQTDPTIYNDTALFSKHLGELQKEIDRSHETFLKHYKGKYTSPSQPPSWMSLEVASMGTLSKIYKNLKLGKEKEAVASSFGLPEVDILENWMFCFSSLRNICAHHGRLWNRRMSALIKLSYNTEQPFFSKKEIKGIYNNKLYGVVCATQYMLNQIEPENDFKFKLKELMARIPLGQEKEMGFTPNWSDHSFWS